MPPAKTTQLPAMTKMVSFFTGRRTYDTSSDVLEWTVIFRKLEDAL